MAKLAALPGVVAAQPLQHRFAYVGTDLQDLYGVDPLNLGKATYLSDAYFPNGSAKATLSELAKTPDGVLVSQETVNDYQLALGDTINLRLQSASNHQYHPVAFRWPETAPLPARIGFDTLPGMAYALDWASNLVDAMVWQPFTNFTSTGSTIQVNFTNGSPKGFCRIKVIP